MDLTVDAAQTHIEEALAETTGASHIGFAQPETGAVLRTLQEKAEDTISVKDFGAVGDGVADDTNAISAALSSVSDSVDYPSGIYAITAKPGGFTTRRRGGAGIVRTPDGDVYPDSDVLRYSPNMDVGDYKLTVARNNANLNADATKRGHYFAQEFDSALPGSGQIFGYVANIKRTGGTRRVVPGQFNGYGLTGTSDTVWGIATEAWNGDATTAGTGSTPLVGAEMSVISQYSVNTAPLIGADVVFKNRADGAAAALGGLGSNAYNRASVGIRVSSQARGTDTAFCGFRKGIEFAASSLDESLDGRAIGIDLSLVPSARLLAAIKFANDQPVIAGSRSSTVFDGWRYVNDGGGTRIEFVRGIETGGTNTVKAKIDLGNNANTNAWVMTQAGTRTTIGATGAAAALPANPLGYFDVRLVDGTSVAIPYYTRGA